MVRLYKNKIRGLSLALDTICKGATSLNNSSAAVFALTFPLPQTEFLLNTLFLCNFKVFSLIYNLPVDVLSSEIQRFAQKHEGRLHHHENTEAIQLQDNTCIVRRLQRNKPFELV